MIAQIRYETAKMLRANKDPSKATVAKTSLVQAPKSKELFPPPPQGSFYRLVRQNEALRLQLAGARMAP